MLKNKFVPRLQFAGGNFRALYVELLSGVWCQSVWRKLMSFSHMALFKGFSTSDRRSLRKYTLLKASSDMLVFFSSFQTLPVNC